MNAVRDIQTLSTSLKTDSLKPVAAADLRAYLEKEAQVHGLTWLLAHADDGVNWGRFDNGLTLSCDVARLPRLNPVTLRSVRLFAPHGEVLVHVDADAWFYRRIIDEDNAESREYFDEHHFLLGTRAEALERGFSRLTEGATGKQHVAPIPSGSAAPRLIVRSYLNRVGENAHGFHERVTARVLYTRLHSLGGDHETA